MRRLPPRQREALVLRYFADLSVNEIAKTMGVSAGTVKSTTARGLAALGRILREEEQ
jgi:RNA polymerase sigma factor (sigma-70 family)